MCKSVGMDHFAAFTAATAARVSSCWFLFNTGDTDMPAVNSRLTFSFFALPRPLLKLSKRELGILRMQCLQYGVRL